MEFAKTQEVDGGIDKIESTENIDNKIKSILEDKGLEGLDVSGLGISIKNDIEKAISTINDNLTKEGDNIIDTGTFDFSGDIDDGSTEENELINSVKNNLNSAINTYIDSVEKGNYEQLSDLGKSLDGVSSANNINKIISDKKVFAKNVFGKIGSLCFLNSVVKSLVSMVYHKKLKNSCKPQKIGGFFVAF